MLFRSLLKKQAPKGKSKAATGDDDLNPDEIPEALLPKTIRWTNTKDGSTVSVPAAMLPGPAGVVFGGPPSSQVTQATPAALRMIVEEVQ